MFVWDIRFFVSANSRCAAGAWSRSGLSVGRPWMLPAKCGKNMKFDNLSTFFPLEGFDTLIAHILPIFIDNQYHL